MRRAGNTGGIVCLGYVTAMPGVRRVRGSMRGNGEKRVEKGRISRLGESVGIGNGRGLSGEESLRKN